LSSRDLEVYRRTEELLYKIYPRLFKYPKSEKFSLCQEIKRTFFSLLSYISRGNSVKSKRKTYLEEADGYLQVLKVLIKLSKQRKYISVGFYKEIDLELTEINKMLLRLIDRNDYIYMNHKQTLKVDVELIEKERELNAAA